MFPCCLIVFIAPIDLPDFCLTCYSPWLFPSVFFLKVKSKQKQAPIASKKLKRWMQVKAQMSYAGIMGTNRMLLQLPDLYFGQSSSLTDSFTHVRMLFLNPPHACYLKLSETNLKSNHSFIVNLYLKKKISFSEADAFLAREPCLIFNRWKAFHHKLDTWTVVKNT